MDTTTVDVTPGHFFLGPVQGADDGENIIYEAADFTTHGVIVGMTGSGKTGLGMILLEEALLQGIPTLVIDPKGDMGNLLLTFPDLAPGDFRPWINEGEAEREGVTPDELAASTAELWENGLGGSGIGKDRIARLRETADFTIYTPGSNAGVALNVIGDLSAPAAGADAESMREEIDGLVQGLLNLVGIDSDPLSGREHVLLANLIHHAWEAGTDLDLAKLLAQIQDPPMRKLGVIELDTFFPPSDRTALAMKLNGLLASPSFAAWGDGVPLDIGEMLEGGGKPKAAIVSIAHLSDEERQFAVTLILSKLVTWMRSQPGSPDLRAMVYMDEVFGFVPPTAQPPAKRPILTILKQARAFGVGMVLSTQNPVDLDYKAISNAGTWMIGRLQTERDKARLLEGMRAAGGDADIDAIGDTIGGLPKRSFLLHTTRGGAPTTFGTRWAMSYLPGPLTRDQIGTLMADQKAVAATSAPAAAATTATPTAPAAAAPVAAPAERELADDESAVAPDVADNVQVAFLDPGAPWAADIGAVAGGRRLEPALAARVNLLFDDTKGDLRHEAEWEAIVSPLGADVDGDDFRPVDYDDRDLRSSPPEGAVYALPDAKIHTKTFFTTAQRVLKDQLYRNEALTLFRNAELKLYSRVGETRDEFAERCARAADDKADEEANELRASMAKKEDRIRAAIAKAEDRLRELENDSKDRKRNELLSGAIDVIGGLFGGKKSTRSILGGVKRASSSRRMSANASERVETAKNRLAEEVDELEALADTLTDALHDSQDAWDEAAAAIDEYEVGLEKTDISVEDLVLVWVPTD